LQAYNAQYYFNIYCIVLTLLGRLYAVISAYKTSVGRFLLYSYRWRPICKYFQASEILLEGETNPKKTQRTRDVDEKTRTKQQQLGEK
jgi:hypothetical protein